MAIRLAHVPKGWATGDAPCSEASDTWHLDEFPGAWHGGDRYLDQGRLASRNSCAQRQTQLVRPAGPPASRAEAFGVFHEIRIRKVTGDQAVAELLLLDAAHVSESAI